jgi:hypothetical protein
MTCPVTELHFTGSDWILDAAEIDPALLQDLLDCGGPGDASGAVAYVRQTYQVTGDEKTCAAYLKGYGAWEPEELADHDANLDRLVWLTGCALGEGESAYFSAY